MGKFIAAMDNSGGSAGGALDAYKQSWTEENKMDRIHNFRLRMIAAPDFNSDNIWAAIAYKDSVTRGISDFLKSKGIETYLKVDEGIDVNGMLKQFPLRQLIQLANDTGCTGTKMRSVINPEENYEVNVNQIVSQQFGIAKDISDAGLMPIIEPEINIHHPDKAELEDILLQELDNHLQNFDGKCILKLTLPNKPNFYCDLLKHSVLYKIVALSGGYNLAEACDRLSQQKCMSASFSRALADGLEYDMTDEKFNDVIGRNIKRIVKAS